MAALVCFGCGNQIDNNDLLGPSPDITEQFSGSVTPNGAVVHNFTVGTAGQVVATLTSFGVDGSIGLSLGNWNGSACTIVVDSNRAVQGTVVAGVATTGSAVCVRIYDNGTLGQTATYQISVVHK